MAEQHERLEGGNAGARTWWRAADRDGREGNRERGGDKDSSGVMNKLMSRGRVTVQRQDTRLWCCLRYTYWCLISYNIVQGCTGVHISSSYQCVLTLAWFTVLFIAMQPHDFVVVDCLELSKRATAGSVRSLGGAAAGIYSYITRSIW